LEACRAKLVLSTTLDLTLLYSCIEATSENTAPDPLVMCEIIERLASGVPDIGAV
jgi:hypothetical protein